jgi:hypothetical protein
MPRLLLLNHVLLFVCCSIYLGTGASLVLFQFPVEPLLTPENYMLIFVDPVTRATEFFTWMTIVMLVTNLVMLATEWLSGLRLVPLIVLVALVVSTLLTILFIIPLNNRLAGGITDAAELGKVFHSWANFNRIRVALWCVEWGAMMYWFYRLAYLARADR